VQAATTATAAMLRKLNLLCRFTSPTILSRLAPEC
jgi:hypothetical protein